MNPSPPKTTALSILCSDEVRPFLVFNAGHRGYFPEVISLNSLLQQAAIQKQDRLQLGIHLAHAVMQFHVTEWLPEIFFPQVTSQVHLAARGLTKVLEPITKSPLLLGKFGGVPYRPTQATMAELYTLPYDKNLISLGIVLIELWFGRPLRDLLESMGFGEVLGLVMKCSNTKRQVNLFGRLKKRLVPCTGVQV